MRSIIIMLSAVAILMVANAMCSAQCSGSAQASCSGQLAPTASCGGALSLRRTPIRNVVAAIAERAAVRATIRRSARASRMSSCGGAAAAVSCVGATTVVVPVVIRVAQSPAVPLNCPDGVCPIEGDALFVPRGKYL